MIGRKFLQRPRRAVVLVITTLLLDWGLVLQSQHVARASVALLAFTLAVMLSEGDLDSLGLRVHPRPDWLTWVRLSLKIAAIVGLCVAVGLGAWLLMGQELRLYPVLPEQVPGRLAQMCLIAPLVEETVYRLILCGLLAGLLGDRTTIVLSGLLFAGLHGLYGNPSPENLVGGYFLAWAYLKSETILLPLILHSAGNAIVLASQIAVAYRLDGVN